ncbi:Uncharacterized protein YjaZ [Amphibacillus marinus]|uniref:Uncharacterized protein YjaZ n=1 Tax=Amphibacillus marinus TaxID=872970 RepID=A0A1H8MES7_9BACI|nr:DUF2268 domain-containing putative Zn-dependent protease [Amphibacillus marinus]SEO15922.1 Uncharacterized protein YjaZ [Amphibacillus marinus]
MSIYHSHNLLENYLNSEKDHTSLTTTIIEPLSTVIDSLALVDLKWLLEQHGLFQPAANNHKQIEQLLNSDVWQQVDDLYKHFQEQWHGPDTKIILLPADLNNNVLTKKFNCISGLTVQATIFLFITDKILPEQLKALIVHEYSHAYRLSTTRRLTLLDTIILEGVAEYLVHAYCDSNLQTSGLFSSPLKKASFLSVWNKWVKPNLTIYERHPLHSRIMYGNVEDLPDLAGYQVGYYLVSEWARQTNASRTLVLNTPAELFLSIL